MWFKSKNKDWNELTTADQFIDAFSTKDGKTRLFFKHSTRCSISSMAKARLEAMNLVWENFYYLDLIAYRSISNLIAEQSRVEHQSPQLIIVKNGVVLGSLSHNGIAESNVLEIMNG